MTDEKSPRRYLGDRAEWIDRQHIGSKFVRREQFIHVADDPGDLHGSSKILWRTAPRFKMRGSRKGRHAPYSFIARRHRQSQGAPEPESGQRHSSVDEFRTIQNAT